MSRPHKLGRSAEGAEESSAPYGSIGKLMRHVNDRIKARNLQITPRQWKEGGQQQKGGRR